MCAHKVTSEGPHRSSVLLVGIHNCLPHKSACRSVTLL